MLLLVVVVVKPYAQKSNNLFNNVTTFSVGGLDSTQYEIKLTDDQKYVREIVINRDKLGARDVGSLLNTISTNTKRGRVKLTADLETADISKGGDAAMFCQLMNDNKKIVAFDNMNDFKNRISSSRPTYVIDLNYDQPITKITVGFFVKGSGKLKVTNLSLEVDSGEFDPSWEKKYSKFRNRSDLESLTNLCQIWGLLKYHHSGIGEKNLDWDSVLVNYLPAFLSVKKGDSKGYNKLYHSMIYSLGGVPQCTDCKPISSDSLSINQNLSWLQKNSAVDKKNLIALNEILKSSNAIPNKYINLNSPNGITALFENEASYKSMTLPNVNYRLLSLFRFWSIINYFYPYKYLIGSENWNTVLENSIPIFINATTSSSYKKAVAQLVASLDDSHSYDFGLLASIATERNKYSIPARFKILDGKIIVSAIDSTFSAKTGIKKGTVVKKIQNRSLQDYSMEYAKYIGASNSSFEMEALAKVLQFVPDSVVKVDYVENEVDKIVNESIRPNLYSQFFRKPPEGNYSTYKTYPDSIAYLNPSKLSKNDALELCKKIVNDKSVKGIIIDCRDPQRELLTPISQYFIQGPGAFAKFNVISTTRAGILQPSVPAYAMNNQNNFSGRVVVLVDATTISKNELLVMALQLNAKTRVIGRTTAGADGDIVKVPLPGNLSVYYSGVRVRYPDGRETQGTGISIDAIVVPTAEDIRLGKDKILEEGLLFLRRNQTN